MKVLMKELSEMNEDELFESKSCPICLEDFPAAASAPAPGGDRTQASQADINAPARSPITTLTNCTFLVLQKQDS